MNLKATTRNLLAALLLTTATACNLSATPTAASLSLPGVTALRFAGSPRYLAWSPDDSHLLITGWFAGEEQIAMVDLDTEEVKTLLMVEGGPEQNGWVHHANWSPDGSQIVFEKDGPTVDQDALKQGIWIMDVVTGDTRLLSEKERSPVWSSTGEYIFVTSPTSIVQLDAATGNPIVSHPVRPEEGDYLVGFYLTRSADDRFFAVEVGPKNEQGGYMETNNRIYVINAESGDTHFFDTTLGFNATWSPNGDVLAFVAILESDNSKGLYLANADGTCITQVLDAPVAIPAWSHDGSKIAFTYQGRVHLLDVAEVAGEGALQSRLVCQ